MEGWTRALFLSLGGVLGVNARYWLGLWINRWGAAHWATFVINISGSFAIGFLAMVMARWLPHPHVRLMILTGFLGGYTTFSTLAYESALFWERGERGMALANLGGSLVTGIIAVLLGMALARDLLIPAWEAKFQGGGLGMHSGPSPEARRLAEDDEGSPDLELPPDVDPIPLVDIEEAEDQRAS
ncbi:fluoride efflux transporter FluC [Tundrisphaera lichenicola]|uniref:fluoride efflux transporter FluC n=1 Tax=Tundrisphaera lichenicola TaxID=2029860 RepID=UPI003EBD1D46